ncbi:TatD family hydrolase [Erysipelothrix sp. HDW6C]|uniref:TatD family hydrolase n=1 Tax=Erysipelothrix sp. HDW6C TaxID=2714930 RepID=UPI00140C8148|nr:TatD family hydrolase [Erysipelothrix sp. HDW6C]QIK69045.1 TatD family hydrolase [Erysipelothrix sp. HDW6C]
MNYHWIDSHAHIASEGLFENFDTIVANAKEHGVTKINIICGTPTEVENALSKVNGDAMFDLSIGVHPTEIRELTETDIKALEHFYTHPQVVCVGEIGLDYYWDDSYKNLQEAMFIHQIELANAFDLPIAVHLRNEKDGDSAVKDALRILKEHPVNKRGVIHCYTDTVENAKQFLDMGYYLGFGGITTFKNGQNVRDVLEIMPIDRILIETDSPFLAPVPMRGKRNEPAYVSYVGKHMNNHFGKDMREQLAQNYQQLFIKSKI